MKYTFIKQLQTVEYDVLHSLEQGFCQAIHIRSYLNKAGRNYSSVKQISSALQRLRRAGLAKHAGIWTLAGKEAQS